jgi:hypothetical protein
LGLIGLAIIIVAFFALFFISDMRDDKEADKQALKAFESYQATIEYINSYYDENQKYPVNIESVSPQSEELPWYFYETFNDRDDFILQVQQSGVSSRFYRYCSRKELEYCDASIGKQEVITGGQGSICYIRHWQLGDWVATYWPSSCEP